MYTITPYITATITILGIAYPILLQVISRLDEKYSSEHILELFNKEFWRITFHWTLIINLVFIVIWSLQWEPKFQSGQKSIDYFISNSANILVALNSIFLVFTFFRFVHKIFIYYTPARFVKHLSQKYLNAKNSDDRMKYIEAMGDILIFSISMNENNIRESVSNFFYSVFGEERKKQHNQPVIYPELLYSINYWGIEELTVLKDKRNHAFENRIGGCQWILGQGEKHEISNETFLWLWNYLRLLVENKHDDMIFYYWRNAHHYYQYGIPAIQKEYDETGDQIIVTNETEYESRESERLHFFEFHYFLGGLLMFENRYDCLRRNFSYTTFDPPIYELLPEFMGEIFRFYNKVRDPYHREYPFISSLHPFPRQNGFGGDSVVKKWVSVYLAVLFLRQYKLHQYFSDMSPVDFPKIPDNQGEINLWIESVGFFKRLVEEQLSNHELLKVLGLDFLTVEWCAENNEIYPLDFIDELMNKLQQAYREGQYLTPINQLKRQQFEYSTREILEKTLDSLFRISNPIIETEDSNSWFINGSRSLYERDAFAKKSEITHIGFDSFLANLLSRKILNYYSNTYYFKKNRTYLLKPEKVFNAIDKLSPDNDFVIIAFNIYLDFYITQLKVKGLSKDNYNGIPIYAFGGSDLVNRSFFILKKTDLPAITTKPIDNKYIKKYKLKKLSNSFDLHASVIDLNTTSDEILNENRKDPSDDEIKKSVLINIHLDLEIKWKNKVEMVRIVEYSEYKQKGLESGFKDIIPFSNI